MTAIRTALLLALVGVVGFALGYFEGKNTPKPTYMLERPILTNDLESLPPLAQQVVETLSIADPLERAVEWATLLRGLGREDMPVVQQGFDSIFVDRHPLDTLIYAHWAAPLDPEGVAAWSSRPMNEAVNEITGTAILEALAHVDPQKALPYAARLSFGAYEPLAIDGLVRGWDESGEPGLDDYILGLETGFDRQRKLKVVARRRIKADGIDGAIRWAEELPEGGYNFKLDVYRQMVTELVAVDVDRAKEFALANYQGPYGKNLLSRLSYYWGSLEPEASLEWCSTLPEGEPRDKSVTSAFLVWMRRDADEPMDWMGERIDRINELEWLQPAVPPYLQRLTRMGGDPIVQLERASKISREEIRERATISVATLWMGRDKAAAEAWIAQAGLSDAAVEQIRTNSQPRRQRAGAAGGGAG